MAGRSAAIRHIRRIIIHVGRHKSGTSSLQHFFNANLDGLEAQGILYPSAGRVQNVVAHHEFAEACAKSCPKETFELIMAAILSEVKPNHHTILISSEAFQQLGYTRRLKSFLSAFPAAQVDIICYFREFVDYMISSFRQATQNQTRFRTFDQFLGHRYALKSFLRKWGRLGTLHLKWFHSDLLEQGDIIADFCKLTDIELENRSHKNMNVSIGGNILFFKLAANFSNQSIISYQELAELATDHKKFRQPFFVSRHRVNGVRFRNRYNTVLEKHLGDVPMKYWDEFTPTPNHLDLDADIAEINNRYPHVDLTPMKEYLDQAERWF